MKITKIYISAFGGLRDYTLEMKDGFTCIFGENENGKTTLMAFLRMMFYGSGRTARQASKNPRQRYQPWSGEPMGGRIYFEHAGKRFCLEREFRKSDATDRVTLRNLDLGTSETVPSDIGRRFFALGDGAFERSVFIGQAGFSSDEDAAGEIAGRLSNLAVTGDEGASYRQVQKRIEDALSELKTPRGVGKYDKGLKQLHELEEQLAAADRSAHAREELAGRIRALKEQLGQTKRDFESVKKTVDSENDLRTAGKMREYLEAKARLDELNRAVTLDDGTCADDSFLRSVGFCLSQYKIENARTVEKRSETERLRETISISENRSSADTAARAEALRGETDALQKRRESLSSALAETQLALERAQADRQSAVNAKKAFHPLLLALGGAAVLAAVVLLVLRLALPGIAAAVAGAVLAVLSFLFRPSDRARALSAQNALSDVLSEKARLENEQAVLQGKINDCTAELQMLTAALQTDEALTRQRKAELLQKEQLLAEQQNKERTVQAELFALTERFCDSHDLAEIEAARDSLAAGAEQVKNQKLTLNILSRDLGNISYEEAAARLEQLGGLRQLDENDFAAAKLRLNELNSRGQQLSGALSEAAAELKNELEKVGDPAVLQKQIAEAEQRLSAQERYYDAAQTAAAVLEESFGELRRGYSAALERKTLDIFSQITGGKYRAVSVSPGLQMEAEADGVFGTHSIEFLSGGTVDQAYLSLRLAAARLMTADEPLPVFLDDVLAQCDDERTARALAFLKEYAADTQVLLFTCHRAVYEAAEKSGASCRPFKT